MAVRVDSAEEFNLEFAAAISGRGPRLIEAMVPPVRL
jgi:thiamine pyrophosphate-dependent acetolactate synthase large subunit-like protein